MTESQKDLYGNLWPGKNEVQPGWRLCFLVTFSFLFFVFPHSPVSAVMGCPLDLTQRPVVPFCPASEQNYRFASRQASDINYIVIHTVQGSLESAVHTFESHRLQAPRSAHFTIGKEGGVVKSVSPQDIAWHAGTSPLGSGGRFPSRVLNENSIGIEHAGFVDDPDFPTERQYRTSAALVRLLSAQYKIPLDREHIVAHSEIKPTKGDPGPHWDWTYFMKLVRSGARRPITETQVSLTTPDSSRGSSRLVPSLSLILAGVGISLLPLLFH